MAKNMRLPEALHIELPVPEGTVSGSAVVVGAFRGIAQTDRDSNGNATVWLNGSANLNVSGAVASVGLPIYLAVGTLLATPALTLGATAATGGTFAAGTYYWKVTAINAVGETVGSNEVNATLVANGTQVLNWGAVAGSGFKVYRGTAPGAENVLVATLGNVTTYTDTGAAGTAATVPATNNTQGTKATATAGGNSLFGYSLGTKSAADGLLEVVLANGPVQV